MEQAELAVGQVEQPAPERPGELGGTGAVVGVRALVDPPGVVEDGEEPDHLDVRTRLLGQAEPVLQHPRPVGNAVVAAPGEGVVFEDGVEDQGDVQFHDGNPFVHRWSLTFLRVSLLVMPENADRGSDPPASAIALRMASRTPIGRIGNTSRADPIPDHRGVLQPFDQVPSDLEAGGRDQGQPQSRQLGRQHRHRDQPSP